MNVEPRVKQRPFSGHERDLVQYIAPHLASAIQRCRVFVERELTGRLLEARTAAQNGVNNRADFMARAHLPCEDEEAPYR